MFHPDPPGSLSPFLCTSLLVSLCFGTNGQNSTSGIQILQMEVSLQVLGRTECWERLCLRYFPELDPDPYNALQPTIHVYQHSLTLSPLWEYHDPTACLPISEPYLCCLLHDTGHKMVKSGTPVSPQQPHHTHPLPYSQLLQPGGIFNGVCHTESAMAPVFHPRSKMKTLLSSVSVNAPPIVDCSSREH